jgi:hypothetical protein
MAAFRGLQGPIHTLKKNVPTGCFGGGKLTGTKHSFRGASLDTGPLRDLEGNQATHGVPLKSLRSS